MRLELPPGYKHIVDLQADFAVTVTHIVVDPRPSPADGGPRLEGRLAVTLCGIHVDTRKTLDADGNPNGMPRWGTQTGKPSRTHPGQDLTVWPGTCGKCVGELAKAELVHAQNLAPDHPDRYPADAVPENEPMFESTAELAERAWDETGRWDPLPPGWKRVGATTQAPTDEELRTRLVAAFWGSSTSDADELATMALAALRGHRREAQAQEAGQ